MDKTSAKKPKSEDDNRKVRVVTITEAQRRHALMNHCTDLEKYHKVGMTPEIRKRFVIHKSLGYNLAIFDPEDNFDDEVDENEVVKYIQSLSDWY